MNLDELRTVQSKERRKDSLQQLRDSFYRDVAAYIQDLKASRNRRADTVDDPFSDNEVRRLSDELETAEEVAEAIYERRVGKVVKLASFAAADMPVGDEGMTGEERELFDDLVARITQNKQAVLDVLSGTAKPADTAEPTDTADSEPSTAGPTNPVEAASQPATPSTSESADPTPDAHAESAPAESDSVLAEAMGTESTSESTTGSTANTAETADSESPESSSVDTEPPASAAETEVPPPEPEREPDAVRGPSTDSRTTTESATEQSDSLETPDPTAPAANNTVESSESTESANETDSAGDDSERTTVRITKNVGEIFGVDGREYTLRSEDVVTLPTANAEPLVERDAALQLD